MKFGILGYGSIGNRHLHNLLELNHSVSWYDPKLGHLSKIRTDIINWADAIVVASPSKNHAQDMIDSVDAGKHVFVEKPFGYDCPPFLAGYLKGVRMKPGGNIIVATGFNLRFHDCVRKTKELIHEIGPLKAAMFTVRQKTDRPQYLRDGIIRNWLSHEIDLARYLLGEIDYVDRCDAPINKDGNDATEAHIVIKFNDVQNKVHFEADYFSSPESRYFWIEGENGSIYVDLVKRNVFTRDNDHRQVLAAMDSWDQNYMDEMKCFIKSIEIGQHQTPLATGEDGVKCLEAVMAAREKAGLLL